MSQAPHIFNTARGTSAPRAIYLDVATLAEPHLTGIGRFVMRLLEELSRKVEVRAFTFMTAAQTAAMRLSVPPWGREIVIPRDFAAGRDDDLLGRAHGLFSLPHRVWDAGAAAQCAALYPLLRPPYRFFRRELGILYDFTTLIQPAWHAAPTIEHFGIFFANTSALHDAAIAISRSTKFDARTMCALANDRITAVYPGPSQCVNHHVSDEPVTRSKNMILVCATLEPRKNGPFLMDWFLSTRAVPAGTELWWVGSRGWWTSDAYMKDLEKRISQAGGRKVKLAGVVSDAQLCKLYRQAAFTIYPSCYEGFGFPVLDSLLHGAPVACSFNSSLQEFACGGVHYFDADEPETLDEAVRQIMMGEGEKIDAEALGRRFNWEAMAGEVLRLAGG